MLNPSKWPLEAPGKDERLASSTATILLSGICLCGREPFNDFSAVHKYLVLLACPALNQAAGRDRSLRSPAKRGAAGPAHNRTDGRIARGWAFYGSCASPPNSRLHNLTKQTTNYCTKAQAPVSDLNCFISVLARFEFSQEARLLPLLPSSTRNTVLIAIQTHLEISTGGKHSKLKHSHLQPNFRTKANIKPNVQRCSHTHIATNTKLTSASLRT